MKILNSFSLKIIAMMCMISDHIYKYIGDLGGMNIPIWFSYIGKLSAPIIFYLIVEGFFNTRSRIKYMKKLFGFGMVMFIIDIALGINSNIFLALALSVALMSGIEYIKTQEEMSRGYINGIIITTIIGILSLFTEASIYGLLMTLIFYFFRDKKALMVISYTLVSLSGMISSLWLGIEASKAVFIWDYQWMMVFSIILILMYSGKFVMKSGFIKWGFYFFYPLHLIIIVIVANFIY